MFMAPRELQRRPVKVSNFRQIYSPLEFLMGFHEIAWTRGPSDPPL